MRLIFYNIGHGWGLNKNISQHVYNFWKCVLPPKNVIKNIGEELKKLNPDFLAVAEIIKKSLRTGKVSQAEILSKKIKLKNIFLKEKYSGIFRMFPIFRKHSTAFLSNKEFSEKNAYMLKKGFKKLILNTKIKKPKLSFYILHLAFLTKRARQEQLKEIKEIIKKDKNPKIVCGDFNLQSEDEIREFMNMLNLKNAWNSNKGDITSTYPSWNPRKRFDYVLYSKEIKAEKLQVIDIRISDHLPLVFDFSLRK